MQKGTLRPAPAILLLAAAMFAAGPRQDSATRIIERSDDLMRGRTQEGEYRMTVIHPDWQRTMAFKFWSEGKDKSFILMLEPRKDRGVTFLKLGNEMWNYIPRINRVIKIPPSMMLQSWMGSDFTNDDLVKESSIADDYSHRLLGREPLPAGEAYKIELLPKPESAVVWGKILYWVRAADDVPLRAEFFNERGEKVRTIEYSEITKMGGRVIPSRMVLTLVDKPGTRTILDIEKVSFNLPLPPSTFTQQHLRQAH